MSLAPGVRLGVQVYVAPFPTTGERLQISQDGGAQARWTADGKELFYLTLDSRMMVVNVSVTVGRFRASVPRELFKAQIGMSPFQDQYAVTRDGQRFLIADPVVEGARHPLMVVLNSTSSLKE